MSDIKPIETIYKGYRFRSRLEARWAVFFDALQIKWEYEKQGYDLGDAGLYLPDFFLPYTERWTCDSSEEVNSGHWVEIKGQEPTDIELRRLVRLSQMTGHPARLFVGMPISAQPRCAIPERDEIKRCDWPLGLSGPYWEHDAGEWAMYFTPFCLTDCMFGPRDIEKAVAAARSARFEHGEQPA